MKAFFVIVFLLSILFPSLHCIGIKSFVPLSGVEPKANFPSLKMSALLDRAFQTSFETWWARNFALRNEMLITKNQLYDWANFGRYHAGYSGNIIQGHRYRLYERGYLNGRFGKRIPREQQQRLAAKLVSLQDALERRGTQLLVVISPTKTEVYESDIPARFTRFGGEPVGRDRYRSWADTLRKCGLRFVDGFELARQIYQQEEPCAFPYSGTHWSLYTAGRAVQEGFARIGHTSLEIDHIRYSKTPIATERDLANLLNLWVPYPQGIEPFPEIVFTPVAKAMNKLSLIGNSFAHEFRITVQRNQLADQVVFSGNAPIPSQEVGRFVTDADAVVFVYPEVTPSFEQKVGQLLSYCVSESGAASSTTQQRAERSVSPLQAHAGSESVLDEYLELGKPYPFVGTLPVRATGLSGRDNRGRWSDGETVKLVFRVETSADDLVVHLDVTPFLSEKRTHQEVWVEANDQPVAHWLFALREPSPVTSFHIPHRIIGDDQTVSIEITITNPVSPKSVEYNSDARRLAIRFERILVIAHQHSKR